MLELLKRSWTEVQDELRRRAGEQAYSAWLQGLRPLLMERGVVYLQGDSALLCERVRRLFRPLLQEVLSAEFGTDVAVEVQPAPGTVAPPLLEVGPQNPVVDDSNRTAVLVLTGLLAGGGREPGGQTLPGNLFVFHGQPGVGKSFLLRWWQEQMRQRPMHFDLLSLLKAFQAAHHERRVDGLRQELLQHRTLIIDELHRIAGKPALQAFVLEVLRERELHAEATVLASRWHPKEIRDLQPSLCSHLLSGFVAKIDLPGPMGRLRFLRALEGAASRNGRAQAIEHLAQSVRGSFPELRSAWAHTRGERTPGKYLELIDPKRTFQRLLARVCERYSIAEPELLGKGQGRHVSMARKVLAWLCVQNQLSRAEVGRYMEHRTRAAVSYLTRSLEQEMATSEDVRKQVEGLL